MARENLRIGDCEVYLNETFLGQTKGGIEFSFERKFEPLTVDKWGSAPLDMALTGNDLKIKFKLAEVTNLNISKAIPEGRYAASGSDSKIGLGAQSGYLLSQDAGLLRLHPRRNTPSNRDEDIYVWKAVSVDTVPLAYKVDEQRLIEITMEALVDETQADREHLGRIGDATIS